MKQRSDNGLTLIETVLAIAISGIVVLALVFGMHDNVTGLQRQRAVRAAAFLAGDLMDEIRVKDFTDPQTPASFGPEEAVRANFDDVDDYTGLTETPPRAVDGAAMTNYAGFTRRVVVVNVPAGNFNVLTPAPTNSTSFKRITVVVSHALVVQTNISVVSKYD